MTTKILVRDSAVGPSIQGEDDAKIASLGLSLVVVFSQIPDTGWEIAGAGDFNGDGETNILWPNFGTGAYHGLNDVWFMNGTAFVSEEVFGLIPDTNWRIVNR